MLEQLRRMGTLAAVVEHGSFSAAARALGTTTSAVSQQIAALERAVGLPLLLRTTRRLGLTSAGEAFHRECVAMVDAANRAEQALQRARHAPSGDLRVTAPAGFVEALADALAPMLLRHADMRVHLHADDTISDLVSHRIDLSIRFGPLGDSPWVARRLASVPMVLCASPAYLARCGTPVAPDQPGAWDFIGLDLGGGRVRPPLLAPRDAGRAAAVRPAWPVRISGNSAAWVLRACEGGLGIAQLTEWAARDALDQGRLQSVLAAWSAGSVDVSALVPPRGLRSPKILAAVEALERWVARQRRPLSAR